MDACDAHEASPERPQSAFLPAWTGAASAQEEENEAMERKQNANPVHDQSGPRHAEQAVGRAETGQISSSPEQVEAPALSPSRLLSNLVDRNSCQKAVDQMSLPRLWKTTTANMAAEANVLMSFVFRLAELLS